MRANYELKKVTYTDESLPATAPPVHQASTKVA